jgi:hypothetical protein
VGRFVWDTSPVSAPRNVSTLEKTADRLKPG